MSNVDINMAATWEGLITRDDLYQDELYTESPYLFFYSTQQSRHI